MHALNIEKIVTNPYGGLPRGTTSYMGCACLKQNISALSASCLVVRKDIYEDVGCVDKKNLSFAFNDEDSCLRLLEHGYHNLWTPFAELYLHESANHGLNEAPAQQERLHNEIAHMRTRWDHLLNNAPAYNPNLALDSAWPYLAPPRIEKPWRH